MRTEPHALTHEWIRPLALGSLFLVILGGVGWMSLAHFMKLQDTQGQFQAVRELEKQVAQLQEQYRQTDPETVTTDLRTVEHVLVQDFTHLTQWAQTLQAKSASLRLHTQYRILNTEKTLAPVEGVTLVPMEIEVQPQGTQSGYRGFVELIRELSQGGSRVDIQELTITGDGQKATHLKIGLRVWMKTTNSVEL